MFDGDEDILQSASLLSARRVSVERCGRCLSAGGQAADKLSGSRRCCQAAVVAGWRGLDDAFEDAL